MYKISPELLIDCKKKIKVLYKLINTLHIETGSPDLKKKAKNIKKTLDKLKEYPI